ncbi:MAG: DUF1622 domain-containing protein [Leptotrichiaceae bacterium]|nr:DUF1622 domain-containing protein [Leptotrichiaceae bacterium]MBP9629598.1 DUF1622 domain-containing protein [Leptotrichiaceae bacterium]
MIVEHFIRAIVPHITSFLELIGITIVVIGALKAAYELIKSKFDINGSKMQMNFAKALAFSLEFKLASELLKTLIIRTWNEVLILSVVVILRVIMTLIIQWEIKNEELKEEKKEEIHYDI